MYFNDLKSRDITSNQMAFINRLSNVIEYYNPAQIAYDDVRVSVEEDKHGIYLKVSIPHKYEINFDLWIAIYDSEIIVFFGDAHEHFEQFEDGINWIEEAVNFVLGILKGRFEVHSLYKGKKLIKVQLYQISEAGDKELISTCGHFKLVLLNPFLKVRDEIKEISFY